MSSLKGDRQQIAILGRCTICYWHLWRRVDGLAGHAKGVGLPHVACASLYRAAMSRTVDRTETVC